MGAGAVYHDNRVSEQALPDVADHLVAKTTVEILNLRPTMSLGLEALAR